MSSNRLFNSHKFNRVLIVALLIWIASAAVGIYVLTRFDALVHGQLYDFGLQFDHAWADAYYSYTQLMYITLGVPIALSFVSIMIGFKSITEKAPASAPKLTPKLVQPQPQPVVRPQPQQAVHPQPQQVARQEIKPKIKENNNTAASSCPKCKKVFSRPLVMLNYENGKNKLVNVCPYCSHTLGNAENTQASKSDFQIADADKKLTH
jgi:DNA-directed RNA polymerase subunit RPC12/RpoP